MAEDLENSKMTKWEGQSTSEASVIRVIFINKNKTIYNYVGIIYDVLQFENHACN